MNATAIDILALTYLILFLIYTTVEVVNISRKKSFNTISFFRLFYAIIYGLVPGLVLFTKYTNSVHLSVIDYSHNGIVQLTTILLLSIIGYGCLNLGYFISFSSKKAGIDTEVEDKKINNLYASGIIILLIGFVSIILWTRVFGSPFGILPYADAIRSGKANISNPLAYFKHLASLVLFSSYIFFILLEDKRYRTGAKGIITCLLFLFSIFWSGFFLIADDGRMGLILFISTFFLYKTLYQKKKKETSSGTSLLVKIAIIALVSFILMSLADMVLYLFLSNTFADNSSSNNLINAICIELGYTLRTQQTTLNALYGGMAGTRFLTDLYSGVVSWLPSDFKPSDYISLFKYNTMLAGYLTGTLPTDLISMCIYDIGIPGVFIIPLVMGIIVKKIDSSFATVKDQSYYLILHILVSTWFTLRIIAYADFQDIMLSLFFIIVGHIIVKTISSIKIKLKSDVEYREFNTLKMN